MLICAVNTKPNRGPREQCAVFVNQEQKVCVWSSPSDFPGEWREHAEGQFQGPV